MLDDLPVACQSRPTLISALWYSIVTIWLLVLLAPLVLMAREGVFVDDSVFPLAVASGLVLFGAVVLGWQHFDPDSKPRATPLRVGYAATGPFTAVSLPPARRFATEQIKTRHDWPHYPLLPLAGVDRVEGGVARTK